jgi:hypothetical protein
MSDVRQAIVDVLQSVPHIGRVHAYERYADNQGDLSALYQWPEPEDLTAEAGQLRGWFVSRKAVAETPQGGMPDEGRSVTEVWLIGGYMALSDAGESELNFDWLLDRIRTAFRRNPTLNGTVATCWYGDPAGIEVMDSGPVLFAGVLCHAAKLRLRTLRFECGEGCP